jgi:hypothetical protein
MAQKLLQSPRFFNEFLRAVKKAGLVGEELNALALFIVVISRFIQIPLNAFVKGLSSAGKNFLVKIILAFIPRSALVEITSASEKAWHYSGSDFRHKVLYMQERNDAAGSVEPLRLLISEGKVIHIVPRWVGGKLSTKKLVAHGPVASISTTTKRRLEIDDENRHVTITMDVRPDQTRKILKAYTKPKTKIGCDELRVWRTVQHVLEKRIGTDVLFPSWFEQIEDQLIVNDVRVRRYYPAFVEACRTVCLIRSFQPHRKLTKHGQLEVDFADFAITALIFDSVFVESLRGSGKVVAGEATRQVVEEISLSKGRPVRAKDLARKLGISMDQAYAKLRYAQSAGVIRQANKPEKSNLKTFLSVPRPRFVPDPEKLFHELRNFDKEVRFIHPVTGGWVVYRRKRD